MIKVQHIADHYFYNLQEEALTEKERVAVQQLWRAQRKYARLTLKKYIYFWLIYNKYFLRELPVQQQVERTYGTLIKEKSNADKKGLQQENYIKKY